MEVEGFGEPDDPASLRPHGGRGEFRRVSDLGEGSCSGAGGMPEDRNCDGGIWGSGSGGECGVGHADHGRGGLSYGGEGEGVGNQFDLRGASGDGGVWSKKVSRSRACLLKP